MSLSPLGRRSFYIKLRSPVGNLSLPPFRTRACDAIMQALVNKACDRCRAKKIKCKSRPESSCGYCQSHNLACTFSYQKRRLRRANPDQIFRVTTARESAPATQYPNQAPRPVLGATSTNSDLYIDYLLERGTSYETYKPSSSHDQLTTLLGPSPNISFFPARRVHAISQRLGHNRLESVLESIRGVIATKLKSSGPSTSFGLVQALTTDSSIGSESGQDLSSRRYVQAYMEMIHPLFPFLCREEFEKKAYGADHLQALAVDKAWCCLYYAVVAVGCQNTDGGSYEAKSGTAWAYFEHAVASFRDLTFSKPSLTAIQALMSMAIFCQSISGFGLESVVIAEAAVMAQSLGINRFMPSIESSSTRTFWVLYYMEKTSCFMTGKVPTLQDSHISCPLPDEGIAVFADYDWFYSFVKYSRLISQIHGRLLGITSVPKPWAECHSTLQSLQGELERWKSSIPLRFRPGERFRPQMLPEPHAMAIALRASYYYHYAHLALVWTLFHCGSDRLESADLSRLKSDLMHTARSVLELTSYIEVAPSTPIWMLALTPLSALVVLFDLVIQHPTHPETSLNLAMLDVASGHFSRVEYASKGILPGSLISEFTHLARQYIYDRRHNSQQGSSTGSEPMSHRQHSHLYRRKNSTQQQSDGLMTPSSSITPMGQELDSSTVTDLPSTNKQPATSDCPTQAPFQALISARTDIPAAIFDMPIGQYEYRSEAPFPAVDEQGQFDDLSFLGVDLMALFDPSYPLAGFDGTLYDIDASRGV
ncbi:fungal-specific transcription factor domain-containing protein [Aspergillus karnatakaensis]|uniref:transcription factor domain-containing protein n=1 Tax=Aspergillus karnatakaensis TaxID=1810916 RepID=UPI003CCD05CB